MSQKKMSTQKLIHILFSRPRTRREAVRRKRLWRAVIMRLAVLVVFIVLLILIISGIHSCAKRSSVKKQEAASKKETVQKSDIQIGFTGAMILHQSILNSYMDENGYYNFTAPFEYVKDYYGKPDIMSCEMEGSIGDEETGISGYPLFCYPDVFPENLESVGFDLQLLATNHIYDGKSAGLANTLLTYSDNEINYTGIRSSEEDKRYKIIDYSGFKIGYADYTYGTPEVFNAMQVDEKDVPLINMFRETDPTDFYPEVESQIQEMKDEGADFIVYVMHWGVEYDLEPSEDQKAIAQKLCDLGVDAIIGGHPHVLQPIEVLHSDDGSHKTFCIYSIGNAFSNQTEGVSMDTAHCEDGVILTMNLHKNKKGTVTITDMNMIPTWVYREMRAGTVTSDEDTGETQEEDTMTDDTGENTEEEDPDAEYDYAVLPLDNVKGLEKKTGLSGIQDKAQASYERTMKILKEGFEAAKSELVTKE